jgi:hypothetical protein
MDSSVFDKTDKGREEIATRKYHIPARMRALLLLVDGKRTLEHLLGNVAGLGLDRSSIDELLAQDLIFMVPGSEPIVVSKPVVETATSARARALARQAARLASPSPAMAFSAQLESGRIDTTSERAEIDAIDDVIASSALVTQDTVALSGALHAFYNRSIKAALGLRGMMLQLKVEKADGIEQLRELRTPFLEAVVKAKGADMATALRDELDALLGGAPHPDPVVIPAPGDAKHGAFDFFNMSSGAVEY